MYWQCHPCHGNNDDDDDYVKCEPRGDNVEGMVSALVEIPITIVITILGAGSEKS